MEKEFALRIKELEAALQRSEDLETEMIRKEHERELRRLQV